MTALPMQVVRLAALLFLVVPAFAGPLEDGVALYEAGNGTLDYDDQRSLTDSAEGRAFSANVMFGVAGTAALTSAVLFVLD